MNKAEVFAALYNAAKPKGAGFINYDPRSITPEEAVEITKGDFDISFQYVKGRVMKINLSGDEFDPSGYDSENGSDTSQYVIDALINTGDTYPEEIERLHLENTRNSAMATQDRLYDKPEVKNNGDVMIVKMTLSNLSDYIQPNLDKILKEEKGLEEDQDS